MGTTKSWRGFVDKTEARLAPGTVQLYSAVVYSSKDDLKTNRLQRQMETLGLIRFWYYIFCRFRSRYSCFSGNSRLGVTGKIGISVLK